MSLKKSAQLLGTPQALYGRSSTAGPPRDTCARTEPEALDQAADLLFLSWGGQDLNLRPTDYESAALTD